MIPHQDVKELVVIGIFVTLLLTLLAENRAKTHERDIARRAIQRTFGKTREEAEQILKSQREWERQEYGDLR